MFKLNKLADYATVIMAYMAAHMGQMFTAKDLAEVTHVALPTVTKLLKLLSKSGLLESVRGAKGGYTLVKPAESISIADILLAVDNQLAITECSHADGDCSLEPYCSISCNWQLISQTIINALNSLSLADMAKPMAKQQIPMTQEIFLDALNIKSVEQQND